VICFFFFGLVVTVICFCRV